MQLRKLLVEADARENDLRTRLADAERRLVVVTRDLEESRAFVSKEDADANELIVAFNVRTSHTCILLICSLSLQDLNEAVSDLAVLREFGTGLPVLLATPDGDVHLRTQT